MAEHDDFIRFLDALPGYQLDRLSEKLLNNKTRELDTDFPAFADYSIECISIGNSHVFKITPLKRPEPFVLKLFKKGVGYTESIEHRLRNNPILNEVISPIFWKKNCLFDESNKPYSIEIQPYWLDGDLEMESKKLQGKPSYVIIDNALNRFLQIAKFYRELEKENILFADGKLSNFLRKETLKGGYKIGVIDLKNFEEATESNLRNNFILNDSIYPLRIPASMFPRELSKVHARHLGLALYSYLLGLEIQDLVDSSKFNFKVPLFTNTENGDALALLLDMLLWKKQEDSLNIEEVLEALKALQLLTQLEATQECRPCNYIKKTIRDLRDNFEYAFQDRDVFQEKLLGLQYVTLNQNNIRRANALIEQLDHSISSSNKRSLNQFLSLQKKELAIKTHNRAPLDGLVSKLERRLEQLEATKSGKRISNNRYSSFKSLGSAAPLPPRVRSIKPASKTTVQNESRQKKRKMNPA